LGREFPVPSLSCPGSVDRVPQMASISRIDDGKVVEVANTWDLERTRNPAGALVESHAYGLSAGPDGHLYAVSMGVFAEEGPQPNSGALLRISQGNSEVVVPDLSLPTSVALDQAGNAYVTTNGLGAPGSGTVVEYPAVAGAGM